MEQSLSDKIKIGSFLCTVLVVLRHSLNLQAFGLINDNGTLTTFIEMGVSKQTEIAVPFFFMVSGFFFFRHTYYGKNEYVRMVAKKWHTLFVPFLFWNLIGMVIILITQRLVCEDEWWRYCIQLLHSDWNGVLWYVRDIMSMMLLVPFYGWIFMIDNKWLYIALFIGLFLHWVPVDCSWLSSEGMLFFFLGGVLQRHSDVLKWRISKHGLWLITAIWLASCFVYPHYWAIHKYNTLLGLIVGWQWLDYISNKWYGVLLRLSPFTFFIYVMHADILKVMKVSLAHFFPFNELVALLAFSLLPVVTVIMLFYIGICWCKKYPNSFLFVTGGRG